MDGEHGYVKTFTSSLSTSYGWAMWCFPWTWWEPRSDNLSNHSRNEEILCSKHLNIGWMYRRCCHHSKSTLALAYCYRVFRNSPWQMEGVSRFRMERGAPSFTFHLCLKKEPKMVGWVHGTCILSKEEDDSHLHATLLDPSTLFSVLICIPYHLRLLKRKLRLKLPAKEMMLVERRIIPSNKIMLILKRIHLYERKFWKNTIGLFHWWHCEDGLQSKDIQWLM